jgi:Flp pilus assembly protein TadD
LYQTPERGALKAMVLANDCLRIVKSASGLDPNRRSESARAFIALGQDQRLRTLARNPRAFNETAVLAVQIGWELEPELRDTATALKLARSLVEGKPDNGDAWQALGVVDYRAGEWQAAREALEKAAALDPEGVDTKFVLAMALWRCADRDGARRWYERAVRDMDDRSRRVHAEAATLLGLSDTPKSTIQQEEGTARRPKP